MVSVEHEEVGEESQMVHLPEHVFLGRQPILDTSGKLWGYELLYRGDGHSNAANINDPARATSTVVMNLIAELGVEAVAGKNHQLLLNCPVSCLSSEMIAMLSPEVVVLEIEAEAVSDDSVLARVNELVEGGYRFALQGATSSNLPTKLKAFSFVKLDVGALEKDEFAALAKRFSESGKQVIAEKVETRAHLLRVQKLGLKLLQGYYFCRPEIVKGKRAPANQQAVMHLLSRVNDPECTRDELARLISDEVSLSFRLLKTLNSAAFGLAREVQTIEHALLLLGEARLRQWVSMLVVSRVPKKPAELSRLALVRAHMCEQLAKETSVGDPKAAFTIGLFSVLDTMMNTKMSQLVRDLPLAQEIKDALNGKGDTFAPILAAIRAYEAGSFAELASLGVPADELTAIWMNSTMWMEKSFHYMTDSGDEAPAAASA